MQCCFWFTFSFRIDLFISNLAKCPFNHCAVAFRNYLRIVALIVIVILFSKKYTRNRIIVKVSWHILIWFERFHDTIIFLLTFICMALIRLHANHVAILHRWNFCAPKWRQPEIVCKSPPKRCSLSIRQTEKQTTLQRRRFSPDGGFRESLPRTDCSRKLQNGRQHPCLEFRQDDDWQWFGYSTHSSHPRQIPTSHVWVPWDTRKLAYMPFPFSFDLFWTRTCTLYIYIRILLRFFINTVHLYFSWTAFYWGHKSRMSNIPKVRYYESSVHCPRDGEMLS